MTGMCRPSPPPRRRVRDQPRSTDLAAPGLRSLDRPDDGRRGGPGDQDGRFRRHQSAADPSIRDLGRVDLNRSDFVDDDRTDYNFSAQLGYSYSLLQNVALNLSYRFSQRFSDESEDEFYRNLVSVGLSASF